MEIRHGVHPEHAKSFDTERLRKEFLIEDLFSPGQTRMVYSHIDRVVVLGVCPNDKAVPIEVSKEVFGVDSFLERRELGVINVGGPGQALVGGTVHPMAYKDGLYIGMGSTGLEFSSEDPANPAKFYCVSGTAHRSHPTVHIPRSKAKRVELGSGEACNKRIIYQLVHPDVIESCQLVMGFTELASGSVWNTMPTHTHERRMEVYMYFELGDEDAVFHLMGEPEQTRHIVVRNEQAVIAPSWSIHSGVGTRNYTFIWAMVGENQTFTDMDHVSMKSIS